MSLNVRVIIISQVSCAKKKTIYTKKKGAEIVDFYHRVVFVKDVSTQQGAVVRKPISANPGLSVVLFFSCLKAISLLIFRHNLKAAKVSCYVKIIYRNPHRYGLKVN